MIEKVRIENFKSLKNIDMNCSKINIIIGKPNTGKSNILEALGVFTSLKYHDHFTTDHKPFSNDIIRHESIMNLFYDNDTESVIRIVLDDIELLLRSMEDKYDLLIKDNKNDHSTFSSSFSQNDSIISYRTSLDFRSKEYPSVKFYRYTYLPKYDSSKFDYLYPPIGKNLSTLIKSNNKIKKLILDLLEPFGYKLYIRPTQKKIELAKEEKGILTGFPLSLTAETIQRLIFLLCIVYSNQDSTIVIEEPETHLFPYYTKYIAELIAKDSTNQYFLSTHNPYFLTSLIEKTSKNALSVFVTDFANYQTIVKKLSEEDIGSLLEEDPFFNIEKHLSD